MSKFYITTPIYYVNDAPHIGHAYTSIACDVMARFRRLSGAEVKFLTGTDEHGQKVEKAAEAAGSDPKSFVDKNSARFRDMAAMLGISNDDFIRTTEKRHIEAVQSFWKMLEKNGQIYLGKYAGWYSVRDEAFYAESELVEGKAPTGAPVEWVEEPSYFFKLSEWGERLLKFYGENPGFIGPDSRRNEVISFVKGGLKDLSVSRTTFKWGIPVPGNETHVMYVWLDALVNYLSALGFPAEGYKAFWPASLHMVGKDILRFHAVYWPAFLMAAGVDLPSRIFAHGWWTNEGQKISKSLGNVIDPHELVASFGLDQARYFLLREIPFGNDGDFSRARLSERVNAELANNIGNLAQRTLTLVQKNCDGRVPESGALEADSLDFAGFAALMNEQRFDLALEKLVQAGSRANEFIDREAPWALKKTDPKRMGEALYALAEALRKIALCLQPFVPSSAAKMLSMLAVPEEKRSFAFFDSALLPGTPLPPPEAVFPRL